MPHITSVIYADGVLSESIIETVYVLPEWIAEAEGVLPSLIFLVRERERRVTAVSADIGGDSLVYLAVSQRSFQQVGVCMAVDVYESRTNNPVCGINSSCKLPQL